MLTSEICLLSLLIVKEKVINCQNISLIIIFLKVLNVSTSMASAKVKVFSGPEFSGNDTLSILDINKWTVEGLGGEAAKTALDDFDWDGKVVMGITLGTSPDNKKVANAKIFLAGELMRGPKEKKAN